MNRSIRALSVFCMLLFFALLMQATIDHFFKAPSLSSVAKHPDNHRIVDQNFSRERGAILVGGKPIAESVPSNDQYKFLRKYPQGRMYASITGWFSRDQGLGGIEASQNAILSGDDPRLFLNRVEDLFGNNRPRGGNVTLTIDPKAQKAAYDGLTALGAGRKGAVVAIQPATGKILAMVSTPTYNPNKLATHDFKAASQTKARLIKIADGPLVNRAIRTRVPPGSTFKAVTASAAMMTQGFDANTKVLGGSGYKLPQSTHVLHNENGSSCGGPKITFVRALEVSCNVAFASTGVKVGAENLVNQADSYGFNKTYFTDLDDSLTRQAVSVIPEVCPKSPKPGQVCLDPPRTALAAIGQGDVSATTMQMAMVAAGIGNSGSVMKPYLVDELQSPDLAVLKKTPPELLTSHAISPTVAGQLTDMMVAVVDSGTGTSAQIPGIRVAGKTGTAQSAAARPPYAWFISFAPADNPQVAVAVLVQDAGVARNQISGNGLAAPIAKRVMEAVLQ